MNVLALLNSECYWDRRWGRILSRPALGRYGLPRHLWRIKIRKNGCGDSPWTAHISPEGRAQVQWQTFVGSGETRAEAYADALRQMN